MDELVPTEDEIEWEMKRLQNHRSGGPSGMRTKHLKGWLVAAKRKKREEAAAEKEHLTEERMTERSNRAGGGETVEIRGDTSTEASNWEILVELVQKAFEEGRLAEEAMWHAVVLITKGKKDYRGIGLVEVM